MKGIRFAEGLKVYPIIAPVAFTTSAVSSVYVDMDQIHWATFLVEFGVMTSDSTDTVTVTVECSTALSSDSGEVTLPFWYRKTEAVGTDTIGAITSATTAGCSVTATDDACMLIIDVDPAIIPGALTDGRWLRLVCTPTAQVAAGVIAAQFIGEPRYPQNSIPSTT